jgi:hypothetical protein
LDAQDRFRCTQRYYWKKIDNEMLEMCGREKQIVSKRENKGGDRR